MKQLVIDSDFIVHRKLNGYAELLKPVLYWDGNRYCCLLGPNEVVGVFTYASTPVKALNEWNIEFQKRLEESDQGDCVVENAKAVLNESCNSIDVAG